jgi:hypothetical protein
VYVVVVLLVETLGWADLPFRNPTENLDRFRVLNWNRPKGLIHRRGKLFEDRNGCSPRLGVISALAVTFCTNGCSKESFPSLRVFLCFCICTFIYETKMIIAWRWNVLGPELKPLVVCTGASDFQIFCTVP